MKTTERRSDKKEAKAEQVSTFDLEARCNTEGCHAKVELEPRDLTRVTNIFGIETVTYRCPECSRTNAIALADIRPELHSQLPQKK